MKEDRDATAPSDRRLQRALDEDGLWVELRRLTPARIGLTHVFVGRDRHGAEAEKIAAGLRAELEAGADPAALGDPFLRGRELRGQSEQDLAGIFGPAFAGAARDLPVGAWSQPVTSSSRPCAEASPIKAKH